MKWRVWTQGESDEHTGMDVDAETPADAAIAFARQEDDHYAEYPPTRTVCVMASEAIIGTIPAFYEVTLVARPEYSAMRLGV